MIPRIYLYGTAERYKNYLRAVTAAGGELCLNGCPETCDGLLLPGGGDIAPWRYGQENRSSRDVEPERDQEELALLAMFAAIKRPVLGNCRGLQTINVFFGGTLLQHIQGHSAAEGIDRFHRVYTAPSFLRELYGEEGIVNSAHHQAVDRLGSGLAAVQWGRDGVVEAVRHQSLPIWAVQWHPERMREKFAGNSVEDGAVLFNWFLNRCRRQGKMEEA